MRKLIAIALTAFLCAAPRFVAASEILNVAVPHRGAWDSSYTEFGLQQGFFKQEGLAVRITYVADKVELESLLVSGKVDIAVGAGFVEILGAWAHGGPVKIISPESTGAPDLFWFGKIAGPVGGVGDLHGQAVGYSAPGSLTYFILRTLLKEAGVDDARLVAVGPATSGYPQVLDAQLAASWSRPPANVNYLLAGEIRIIARANDSPQVRNETTRVNAVNVNFLASHRGAAIGFLKAYRKSVDWAYSNPLALDAYAKLSGQSSDAAKYIFKELTSREGAQIDQIKGEDRVLAEALAAKRIPHALTHEDIRGVYDFVAK
jgi:ABC-type nitrate/sulfonate/bicarbonate transport system substrate-binding protein